MAIVLTPVQPVAFSVMGVPVRWYALAYIAAFVVGYFLFQFLMRRRDSQISITHKQLDDLLTAIILGVIIGGRLGYVLIYNLGFFIAHPLEIFAVWHGGMSFHGGLCGVLIAVFMFAHRQHINPWRILDLLAVIAPIGLFFGRIANFINMELIGRVTDVPWAITFAGTNIISRHPSPIYEAMTEGVLLFIIMTLLYQYTSLRRRPGALAGIMGMGYAACRMFCEQFRAPDAQIGFLTSWGLTMGQLLSSVMFVAGLLIFIFAMMRDKKSV